MQEDISKEFEEKKGDLQPKVVEIYEASAVEIKVHHVLVCIFLLCAILTSNNWFLGSQTLVKKPTKQGLKKKSTGVVSFIEELVKIGKKNKLSYKHGSSTNILILLSFLS